MALGVVGIVIGFLNSPKTIKDVEKLLADSHHGHEATHVEKVAPHAAETHAKEAHVVADSAVVVDSATVVVSHASDSIASDSTKVVSVDYQTAKKMMDEKEAHAKADAHSHDDHKAHLEHVLHQLQNKPWAALYVACIFFMLISVGVLAFYAIQYAAQAGWSPILFRVMEGITA